MDEIDSILVRADNAFRNCGRVQEIWRYKIDEYDEYRETEEYNEIVESYRTLTDLMDQIRERKRPLTLQEAEKRERNVMFIIVHRGLVTDSAIFSVMPIILGNYVLLETKSIDGFDPTYSLCSYLLEARYQSPAGSMWTVEQEQAICECLEYGFNFKLSKGLFEDDIFAVLLLFKDDPAAVISSVFRCDNAESIKYAKWMFEDYLEQLKETSDYRSAFLSFLLGTIAHDPDVERELLKRKAALPDYFTDFSPEKLAEWLRVTGSI